MKSFRAFVRSFVAFFASLFGVNRSKATTEDPILAWELPETEDAKLAFIGKQRDEVVTTYLWYNIGDVGLLTPVEVDAIVAEFFVSGSVNYGDVELHRSSVIPGNLTILRLRGTLRLRPALMLRGRYCPLYMFGHSDMKESVNFHTQWNPQQAA